MQIQIPKYAESLRDQTEGIVAGLSFNGTLAGLYVAGGGVIRGRMDEVTFGLAITAGSAIVMAVMTKFGRIPTDSDNHHPI